MRFKCKSRVMFRSAFNTICPYHPCEVEVEEFEPRGCLCNAFYQEWEKINNGGKETKNLTISAGHCSQMKGGEVDDL